MNTISHLDDPQYWLDRAEAIRALAQGVSDDKKRGALLETVRDYEDLARRALLRLAQRQQRARPKTD